MFAEVACLPKNVFAELCLPKASFYRSQSIFFAEVGSLPKNS